MSETGLMFMRTKFQVDDRLANSGVYALSNEKGEMLYIGSAGCLLGRFGSHLKMKTASCLEFSNFSVIQVTGNYLDAIRLEHQLIKKFKPKLNGGEMVKIMRRYGLISPPRNRFRLPNRLL